MSAPGAGKTILIIGGGVAGLAAGCYAQMNGFQATILEQHKVPGGLCTAWKRRGYTFDISLHMVSQSRSGGFAAMWRELGVLQGRTLHDHADRGDFELDGEHFVSAADLDQLEADMLSRSPQDEAVIRELVGAARKAARFNMAQERPVALMSPWAIARFVAGNLGLIRFMNKWGKVRVADFAARFRDPLLRGTILAFDNSANWPMPNVAMAPLLLVLGMAHNRNLSYAVGGGYEASQRMAQRFQALGGELRTRMRVTSILTRSEGASDRAVGVVLADGSELYADYVISAADGRTTIWEWLGGRYVNEQVTKPYSTWKVYPPLVQVMLGVNRRFEGISYAHSFPISTPIQVADKAYERMEVLLYSYDPTMAPAGKTAVQVWYSTEYAWWQRLADDPAAYRAEKMRLAEAVIDALDAHWPGLRAQVEVVDVATPVTFRRYTGNEQGSPDGWCSTTENMMQALPPALPGLSHFYMCGQWTMPFAGVPGSCMTGRDAIQYICRDEKRRFVKSEPPADWRPAHVDAPEDDAPDTLRQRAAPGALPALHAVAIDERLCTGCGDCAFEAPAVFALGDDGLAHVQVDQLWLEVEDAVRRALANCPEQAIHVRDEAPREAAPVA
jgi:phytoene dehydrogenase-like protein/ferredoxin